MQTNLHAERARARKTDALADEIETLCRAKGIDPYADARDIADLLTNWTDFHWRALAKGCGQNPPSDITKGRVIARFVRRAEP